jgi:thiol:disulfide interchange protein
MEGIEVHPNVVRGPPERPQLHAPFAKAGGGLFAITADWCGHCKTLKANVKNARTIQPFDFYWMDGDKTAAHQAKASELKVQGFPTLYYIERDGQLMPYTGGRGAEDLVHIFHQRR